MAQVDSPGGKGRRRSYDASINLVPYIDLMTTIITFLMMAAVWTQIASLEIQNGAGEEAEVIEQDDPPKLVHVFLTAKGIGVYEEGGTPMDLPNIDAKLDFMSLAKFLEQLKKDRPDRSEISISIEDGVKHGEIVKVMDMATNLGLLNITMKPLTLG